MDRDIALVKEQNIQTTTGLSGGEATEEDTPLTRSGLLFGPSSKSQQYFQSCRNGS